ncbi:ATP-binding protein [Carbonactinospora thermoautotrophica]|uniref:ATP-binding protein n=2 Tax=Carbonactinospora thermoautotrophica TaxID=1469144 RepID=UPI00082ACEC6|nr:ATP-binding protein [Carbonactinospora thermoautotrophica]
MTNTAISDPPRTGAPARHSPDVFVWALRPQAQAVKTARELAKTTLQAWGMTALASDAALAVSELVTNAICHACPPYELRLHLVDDAVVVEVVDGLTALPPMPTGQVAELTLEDIDGVDDMQQLEGGRGLDVVYRLSQGRCGARFTNTCTTPMALPAKAVWFALAAPPSAADSGGTR